MPSPRSITFGLCVTLGVVACSPEVPIGEIERDPFTRFATEIDGHVLEIDLYLPDGVGDGARALVRQPAYRRYSLADRSTLMDGAADFELHGDLRFDVADPCLSLTVSEHGIGLPDSDVLLRADPIETFCPIVAEPPTAVAVRASLLPTDLGSLTSLTVSGAPIEPASLTGITARVDGVEVALVYSGDEIGGALTLATPVEPNQVVTIDTSGVETFDGTAADVTVQLLQTTSVLDDLEFTSAPPPGAVAWIGYQPTYVDGTLRVEDEGGYRPRVSPLGLLIALGDVGEATEIRVQGTSRSPGEGGRNISQLVVYREGGLRSESVYYGGDQVVSIPPGTGAVWLAIANELLPLIPSFSSFEQTVLTIDSITLLD